MKKKELEAHRDLMPTIEEIEGEMEAEYNRYMSLTPAEYRAEVGIKSKKVKLVNLKKVKRDSRKNGPVKIYTPDEVRAFNIARGLI